MIEIGGPLVCYDFTLEECISKNKQRKCNFNKKFFFSFSHITTLEYCVKAVCIQEREKKGIWTKKKSLNASMKKCNDQRRLVRSWRKREREREFFLSYGFGLGEGASLIWNMHIGGRNVNTFAISLAHRISIDSPVFIGLFLHTHTDIAVCDVCLDLE